MDISKLIGKPVVVSYRDGTSIELMPLRFRDIGHIEAVAKASIGSPIKLVAAVLTNQLADASQREFLEKLPPSKLRRAAAAWAAEPYNLNIELPRAPVAAFKEFREAADRKVAEWRKHIEKVNKLSKPDPLTARLIREALKWQSYLPHAFQIPPEIENLSRAAEMMRPAPEVMLAAQQAARNVFTITHAARELFDQFERVPRLLADSLRLPLVETGRIFASIPDITSIAQAWVQPTWYREIEELGEALGEAFQAAKDGGYEFAMEYVAELDWRGSKKISERVRPAIITNRVAGLTRSSEFTAVLVDIFTSSRSLVRRLNIVQAALGAHRRREYELSVPVLLAQVEGVYTELLIAKGAALRKKGRIIIADNGKPKLKPKKQGSTTLVPKTFGGMQQKLQSLDYPAIRQASAAMLDLYVNERNAILHGERVDYARAKLSTQLVLLLMILGQVLGDVEAGRVSAIEA